MSGGGPVVVGVAGRPQGEAPVEMEAQDGLLADPHPVAPDAHPAQIAVGEATQPDPLPSEGRRLKVRGGATGEARRRGVGRGVAKGEPGRGGRDVAGRGASGGVATGWGRRTAHGRRRRQGRAGCDRS